MAKGECISMKRQLILEDGTVLIGKGFGGEIEKSGEVVFTTGMTGYQETLSGSIILRSNRNIYVSINRKLRH